MHAIICKPRKQFIIVRLVIFLINHINLNSFRFSEASLTAKLSMKPMFVSTSTTTTTNKLYSSRK